MEEDIVRDSVRIVELELEKTRELRVLEKDRERVSERESFPLPFTCCRNGCFIPVGGEFVSTPSLSFVVPRDMTEIYGGRATTVAWGEGMACHATLMGMELGSKKDRHKSPHKTDRATRGKGLADTLDEPPAPRSKLDEANGHQASVEADLEKARSESANLERQLADLRKRLGDSKGQLRSARAQVPQMETELLDLARSKEALWEDLLKRAVEKYKESPGFEMGLVRMGRVSLEYGYQLALAQLQARHPGVEIKLDPFITLPEDADVPMVDEQPFDDSLPPPEE
ncbi:hypothetical protein BHE74_00055060 [Ensete ventricosum]|nr:hypothetical protein BHE74_00055060 [Ensete ventricosum]